MKKMVIYSPDVARSPSPHSHAVTAAGLVFVSGCAGYDNELKLALGDFSAQFRQALANLDAILTTAGSSRRDVVKVTIYLDSRSDFEAMNSIYREFFGSDPDIWPARTTIEARLPRKDFLVEVECVAVA